MVRGNSLLYPMGRRFGFSEEMRTECSIRGCVINHLASYPYQGFITIYSCLMKLYDVLRFLLFTE